MDTLQRKPSFTKTTPEDIKLSRKSSLPANLTYSHKTYNKNWFKDQKWTNVPENYSIAEDHKIKQLQDWLESVGKCQDLKDLEEILDWENNKPTSQKGNFYSLTLN